MLGSGATVDEACTAVQISRAGLYKRMSSDDEFKASVYAAKAKANEQRMEEYEALLMDNFTGKRKDDYNLLRELGHHTRWKAKVTMPEQYGEQKSKAGVEITDGGVKIMWES